MACFRDYRARLKPGEHAVVMVLAADKDQAGVVFDYIAAFFDNIPMLSAAQRRACSVSTVLMSLTTRSGTRKPAL